MKAEQTDQAPEVAVGELLGFIVLISEYEKWTDCWDGEVHDFATGIKELAGARAAGYTAILVACVRQREEGFDAN